MMILPSLTPRHALFLDFDGTLAPIAARPDLASLSPTTHSALERILPCLGGAVAIVSGRALADLRAHTAPLSLRLAAGHGAEIDGVPCAASAEDADALERMAARLAALSAAHEGLLLERKAHGVALHYRARPDLQAACADAATEAIGDDPRWRLLPGKMVFEIAPASANKGRALAALLETAPFAGRAPLAAGDDVTDEAMFEAANALGGVSIKIGAGETRASHRIDTQTGFVAWLTDEAARLEKEAER